MPMTFTSQVKRLTKLCLVSKEACNVMSSMIFSLYSSLNSQTTTFKRDNTAFTIADGIVQNLLVNNLFAFKFRGIVGEEDSKVNIFTKPYMVDNLVVPEKYYDLIDRTRHEIRSLAAHIDDKEYKDLTVFIDPIDGTREFSTGKGEQASICIGFSDSAGKPVAGLVFRPIPKPSGDAFKPAEVTWAMGAASEGFAESQLDRPDVPNNRGFLTRNGGVSTFVASLMSELDCERVPSGGAANKMLMLLEGYGSIYIQDSGNNRWDTCAAQAVLEAHGGVLAKLSSFTRNKTIESYTYLKSELNLDFEPGLTQLVHFNARSPRLYARDEVVYATFAESLKPYSNGCGLLVLSKEATSSKNIDRVYKAIQRALEKSPPMYV